MPFSLDMVLFPFAWLLRWLYFLLNSYGLAIILFCLLTKILLFPLSLKGKKSMIRMSGLSAQQQEIQRKYGKDQARINQEVQALYAREKVSPMGGCLWSLLPLPLLMGLYSIMRQPLHYLMALTTDQINNMASHLTGSLTVLEGSTGEIKLAELLFQNFDQVVTELPELATKIFRLDFSFLGLSLAETPNLYFWQVGVSWATFGLFLIPIVSAGLSFLSMQISMKTNEAVNKTKSDQPNPANSLSMKLMMPALSLWIGFTMPAGLGIYWISNSLFTMLQEQIASRILKKDYEKMAQEQAERELKEKQDEKDRKRLAAEERAKAIEEAARNKKKAALEKKRNIGSQESRVGIRAYARGRAYEAKRYSEDGPTPYKDPLQRIDEAAVEAALAKKKKRWGKEVAEPAELTDGLPTETDALDAAQAEEVAPETDAQDPAEVSAPDRGEDEALFDAPEEEPFSEGEEEEQK